MSNLREAAGSRSKDLTGYRFGRLTAISIDSVAHGQARWLCVCDCGNKRVILSASLRRGVTVSCGCYFREVGSKSNLTHGMGKTKTAGIWRGMIARCSNPSAGSYAHYGGRGIAVCERWLDYENFLSDMGECPSGHSIERVDNDKGYNPENCVWLPKEKQARNRRNTLRFDGKPLIEISEETGISYATLYFRLKKYGTPFKDLKNV